MGFPARPPLVVGPLFSSFPARAGDGGGTGGARVAFSDSAMPRFLRPARADRPDAAPAVLTRPDDGTPFFLSRPCRFPRALFFPSPYRKLAAHPGIAHALYRPPAPRSDWRGSKARSKRGWGPVCGLRPGTVAWTGSCFSFGGARRWWTREAPGGPDGRGHRSGAGAPRGAEEHTSTIAPGRAGAISPRARRRGRGKRGKTDERMAGDARFLRGPGHAARSTFYG